MSRWWHPLIPSSPSHLTGKQKSILNSIRSVAVRLSNDDKSTEILPVFSQTSLMASRLLPSQIGNEIRFSPTFLKLSISWLSFCTSCRLGRTPSLRSTIYQTAASMSRLSRPYLLFFCHNHRQGWHPKRSFPWIFFSSFKIINLLPPSLLGDQIAYLNLVNNVARLQIPFGRTHTHTLYIDRDISLPVDFIYFHNFY